MYNPQLKKFCLDPENVFNNWRQIYTKVTKNEDKGNLVPLQTCVYFGCWLVVKIFSLKRFLCIVLIWIIMFKIFYYFNSYLSPVFGVSSYIYNKTFFITYVFSNNSKIYFKLQFLFVCLFMFLKLHFIIVVAILQHLNLQKR